MKSKRVFQFTHKKRGNWNNETSITTSQFYDNVRRYVYLVDKNHPRAVRYLDKIRYAVARFERRKHYTQSLPHNLTSST